MVELFANSGDADQTPRSAASELGLHCLPVPFQAFPDYSELITSLKRLLVQISLKFKKFHRRKCKMCLTNQSAKYVIHMLNESAKCVL